MTELVIIRGIPGSGKSTLAKEYEHSQGHVHVEADMYLMQGDEYVFSAERRKMAHHYCRMAVEALLQLHKSVVVSNTFTQRWEMSSYFEVCHRLGIPCRVIEATGNYKSVHNVPQEAIDRMKARWEPNVEPFL
jgi:predicted kinase